MRPVKRAGVHLHHGSPCLCAAGLIVGVLAADSRTGAIDEGKAEVGDRPGHMALAAGIVATGQGGSLQGWLIVRSSNWTVYRNSAKAKEILNNAPSLEAIARRC
jgi:hypothetical protein